MQEAIMIFESILNSQWFKKSALILFLNKMDIFKTKLEHSPIKRYFSDYTGDPTDWKAASKYFLKKFKYLNRDPRKEIYAHFTTATDTNLLKVTMDSVQDRVTQLNLESIGLN